MFSVVLLCPCQEPLIKFIKNLIIDNPTIPIKLRIHNKNKGLLSDIVPYQTYCEYQIEDNGNNINFILAGDSNAFCIIEIVENGTIVFNGLVSVNSWMVNTISLGNIRGKLYMRFQSQGPDNIFRVIEIIERKALFFGKRRLCGWIS